MRIPACVALLLLATQTGVGDELAAPGVSFSAAYTADLLRNVHGGREVGGARLDNIDAILELDGERAFGAPGLKLFAYALYNDSAQFSDLYPGDAGVVSNIDAPRTLRLYEAWGEWSFGARDDASLRVGLYDLNSEFDVGEARSLFLNSAFGVGHELGQTGRNGPSIFPVTSFGARLAVRPAQSWLLRAAVLDGVPGDGVSSEDGALMIGEAVYESTSLGKLALGVWSYTREFGSGGYFLAERALWEHDDGRTLAAFMRYGAADASINEFSWTAQAGLVMHRPFASEAAESLGLAVSRLQSRIAQAETAVELTYRRALTPWLTLQPNLQLIMNPGADGVLRDALVVGLRVEMAGAW
jgi:porin